MYNIDKKIIDELYKKDDKEKNFNLKIYGNINLYRL